MSKLDKINYFNIFLMLFSCAIAIVIPFELFLFAYAVLGPLHYLTEISWLHDRQYYTKGKYDYLLFIFIGILILFSLLNQNYNLHLNINGETVNHAIYFAIICSVIFVFINKFYVKLIAVVLAFLTLKFADSFFLILSVFVPTLIHVFVFTALFVLYGALKTNSKSGYISFVVMILCPVLLFSILPDVSGAKISAYGLNSYKSFEPLNYYSLKELLHVDFNNSNFIDNIYYSRSGILLMRFIAFAYTYHYLNWFSKTNVIRWHEIPKRRLMAIGALWIASISLYAYSYKLGFECLFFLSFLHVLLELPLNVVSIRGIFQETGSLLKLRPQIKPIK